jgi:hypothetical protein
MNAIQAKICKCYKKWAKIAYRVADIKIDSWKKKKWEKKKKKKKTEAKKKQRSNQWVVALVATTTRPGRATRLRSIQKRGLPCQGKQPKKRKPLNRNQRSEIYHRHHTQTSIRARSSKYHTHTHPFFLVLNKQQFPLTQPEKK